MRIKFMLLSLFLICAGSVADEPPVGSYSECTTTPATFYPSAIKTNDSLSREMKRAAVLRALGSPSSNPNYAQRSFKDEWFYARETTDAVFAGYNVRGHYLGVAILYTDTGLETIICDSANLKQSDNSIHKNASLWKEDLNAMLRVELGQVATKRGQLVAYREHLQSLKNAGYITDKEFARIDQRIGVVK